MVDRSFELSDQALAPSGSLPPAPEVEKAFGLGHEPQPHKVLVFPVLANSWCAHHLAIYTAALPENRVRLVAFAKRESRDPKVPDRDWTELCRAEMPLERLDEFVELLQDRVDGGSLELRELDLGAPSDLSELDVGEILR